MDRVSEKRRILSPGTQPSPVMQVQENEANLLPFATCSRVVNRSPPSSLPSQSCRQTPKHYGDTFWEDLTRRPSPVWMEEPYISPMLRATGCSQLGLCPSPEGLPPPEMLCRRRRRPQLDRMQQGPGGIPARVRAVAYHLEDLRRRQRTINELKKAQWGISEDAPKPLAVPEEDCGFLSTREYPDLEKEKANHPQEEDHFITPAALVSLESPGPGQGLCLQTTELSGLQHCHGQKEPCLQSLGDGVGV
ncbi:protein INCA1 isoform X2 [Fukomys damarensis]|uniref:protein INCA1 isoform X2 n=1 Tax=Fukomys damarensis TaxID=885580 RepID=UPI00053F7924|nr:protein INCA1 isoform X2 [Fukomys damarensis]